MEAEQPSSPAPPAEDPASASTKTRKKRVKTGCKRCRIRRRKCDEGKPRCKRCSDRNLDCEYPTGLTFLSKNIVTVAPSTILQTAPAPQYSRLQFVEPKSSRSHRTHSSPSQSLSSTQLPTGDGSPTNMHLAEGNLGVDPSALQSQNDTSPDADMGFSLPDHDMESVMRNPPTGLTGILGSDVAAKAPSDGFESALQGLLSLNNEPHLSFLGSPSVEANEPSTNSAIASQYSRTFSFPTPQDASVSSEGPTTSPISESLSSNDTIRLVRHYRYELAPWLDMCDLHQFFGAIVPRMALGSPVLHRELLAFASTSLEVQARIHVSDIPVSLLSALHDETSSGNCIVALLLAVHTFISTTPDTWPSILSTPGFAAVANRYSGQKYGPYLSCLHLRLDLAVALMTGVTVPPEHISTVQTSLQWNNTHLADVMFNYVNRALVLCAQAVNICAEDPVFPHGVSPGVTLAQHWRIIAEGLNTWYANRPHEFQPMVELDLRSSSDEPLFPTILCTSGAAVMGNQMYHTAMMIMLQHKPRTLTLDGRRSPVWSPLWHAQRVCGIALNNDRREYWDPALAASFYAAAKGMTYEPQQREILRCLDNLSRIAGWNFDHFKTNLCQNWDMMDSAG